VNNGPSIIDSEHRNSTNGYTNDQTHTYETPVKYSAGVPTLDILMEKQPRNQRKPSIYE